MMHDCYCCVWADDEGICVRDKCYLLEEEKEQKNDERN